MIDTQFSTVSGSECDGNGHLNVGNYVRRFSDAGQNFLSLHGTGAMQYRPANRLFRFHRELKSGARARVSSIKVGAGSHAGDVLHILHDADRDMIAATCIDSDFGASLDMLPATGAGAPTKAQPRSLSPAPFDPVDSTSLVNERLAKTAFYGRVSAQQCGTDGILRDSEMVEHFFDAANHAWRWAGLDEAWMAQNSYGMAAIEMKLTHHTEVRAQQDFEIISWVPKMGAKFLPLSHQLVGVGDARPLASISAVAVVLDRKSRVAVDVPQAMRTAHANRFSQFREMEIY